MAAELPVYYSDSDSFFLISKFVTPVVTSTPARSGDVAAERSGVVVSWIRWLYCGCDDDVLVNSLRWAAICMRCMVVYVFFGSEREKGQRYKTLKLEKILGNCLKI